MLPVDDCVPKLEKRTEAEGRCSTQRRRLTRDGGATSCGLFVHVPLDGMLHEFAGAA